MWPKAFAQLIELAPHVSRLLPMADRFFQSKAANDEATRKATEAVEAAAEDLRSDFGKVTAAHAELGKQILDLNGSLKTVSTGVAEQVGTLNTSVAALTSRLDTTAADIRGARLAAESVEARLTKIEKRQGRIFSFFTILFVMLAAVLILLAMLFARGH